MYEIVYCDERGWPQTSRITSRRRLPNLTIKAMDKYNPPPDYRGPAG